MNQHLRAALTRHPELTLADWAAVADQPGLSYDAIHLNTTGAALYARLLRTEVDGIGRLPGGQTLEVAVAGTHGVPADAAAVVLNVTVDDPKYAGYVTVAAVRRAAAVGLDRQLRVGHHRRQPRRREAGHGRQGVRVHLRRHPRRWSICSGGSRRRRRLHRRRRRCAPSTPAPPPASRRARPPSCPSTRRACRPAPSAVVVNVTAVDPARARLPERVAVPGRRRVRCRASTTRPGQTVADLAVTPRRRRRHRSACRPTPSAHVLVDVMGWFAAGSPFTPVTPKRVLDTRAGPAVRSPAARCSRSTWPALGGVPAGAVGGRHHRHAHRHRRRRLRHRVPVRPAGAAGIRPRTTRPARSVPALTLAALPADGKVCVFTYATADVIVDLSGWVAAGAGYVGHHADPPGRHPLGACGRLNVGGTRARAGHDLADHEGVAERPPTAPPLARRRAATTATMPMPRLNTRAISSSLISPRALDLGEDGRHRPRPSVEHGVAAGRQHAGHVAGEAAAGDVGEAVHADRAGAAPPSGASR